MESTLQSHRLANLSPLNFDPQKVRPAVTKYPADDTPVTQPEPHDGMTWGKVGLLAVGTVSAATGLFGTASAERAPEQVQQQLQSQETTKLLETLGQSQAHYFMRIGIIGKDVEVTQQKAAEQINAGLEIVIQTHEEVAVQSPTDPVSFKLTNPVETQIHSAEQLEQFIASRTDRVANSETERVSRDLRAYQGVQGNFYHQLKDVGSDGAGGNHLKTTSLSPFEAAKRLLEGRPVAFTATPLSEVIEAHRAGRSVDLSKGQVQIIKDREALLSLPSNFDSAQKVPRVLALADAKAGPNQYFFIGQQNDSMPGFLNGIPTSAGNRNPFTHQMDDNGWTADVRADYTRTQGNEQWVGELRSSMLTQRGSWQPGPDYHGYRTDMLEFGVQKNTAHQLSGSTTLYTGVGAGAQLFGPMGGHNVQLWVHTQLPFGGRTDAQGLQTRYTTNGISFTPEITGGIGLDHALNGSQSLKWTNSLEGNLALGGGYSTLRAQSGLKYELNSHFNLTAGVSVDGMYDNQRAANMFMHDSGIRTGEYIQGEAHLTKNLSAFARVQNNGLQGEPLYLVGVAFGGGSRPWLDPLFR